MPPYIDKETRSNLDNLEGEPNSPGELQYLIAKQIKKFLKRRTRLNRKIRYQDLNDVMGALAGAQMEFYRIKVEGYEDRKMEENGGVY